MLDLDKPHPPLHHPPGREQLHGEVAAVGQIEAVEPLCFLRLLRKIDQIGHARLHPEGEFVGGDPGGGGRVSLRGSEPVEPLNQPKALALCRAGERTLRRAKIERVGRIDPQRHRIVGGAEVEAVFLVPVFAGAEGDKLREIIVQRAEAIVNPGAERGKLPVEHIAAGVELGLRHVVGVGRPH